MAQNLAPSHAHLAMVGRNLWEDGRVWKKVTVGIAVVAVGGYAFADAWDLVPGPLTTKPEPAEPLDYPTIAEYGPATPVTDAASVDPPEQSVKPPAAEQVDELIAALASDQRNTGRTAVIIADALTGEPIATREADRPALPASNMKIVTAAAALHKLGPETTLPTVASLTDGTVHLVGGGDVLMTGGKGDPQATIGRAGLADLAEATAAALKDRGATAVNVQVDSSLFSGPQYFTDIEGADRGYVMELRPIAIDRGRITGQGYLPNPDLEAGKEFAERLRENGIEVGTVERAAAPQEAAELARVESAPVRELVDHMLTVSDNSVAEVLGHLVGIEAGKGGTFAGSSEAIMDALNELGVRTDGVVLGDASGLSEMNRLTANSLHDVLNHTWECDACTLAALPAGLPVGGLDGTLSNRFHATEIPGQVRAKTGTLVKAISLSGYMRTNSGYPLTFVILMDELEEGTAPASRALQDEFLDKLAAL
ncbi:D-alanyl-D-alanine carboxypeptidase/D-alanyl-D-alanine endopeptidase [Trueperella bialowiezensis]|uniref:D-alanyl-D-alanine carboxypeptidase dacC n=1 Tax=Trueperella bialowiezensis TaxID=312285 RepID=A0A3S4Z5V4_9ACTO|nr:D-alanyl-D-alanine carboxypeptidase/D-alanyl-D-alanine-endopeptidase [Trueperella bialowiezensis]VEI13649.1 D-alanyl-D-alanine carboxypeptidase dacC precursor [Trueperella bialowiezensis]